MISRDNVINLKDKRLKCLLYNIAKRKFVPVRCTQRVTVLCIYSAGHGEPIQTSTISSSVGPAQSACAGVPPPGKPTRLLNHKNELLMCAIKFPAFNTSFEWGSDLDGNLPSPITYQVFCNGVCNDMTISIIDLANFLDGILTSLDGEHLNCKLIHT